ncbi:MAG TPA: 2-amino-4-hydroxy-6-hydroxymethyldihydropteridine diphosphokinase [Streptosporangiaceae bacterium]
MTTSSSGRPAKDPHHATLGLGSNLGDRLSNLQGAVDALGDTPGVVVEGVSPVYETAPFGGKDQPDYLNAVVTIRTGLSPRLLLERAFAVEDAFGRVRAERWGSRTLDVDVITYDEIVSADPELTVPHPGAHERATVLAPWHDIAPGARVPGRGAVADLLAAADMTGVHRRDDLALVPPE